MQADVPDEVPHEHKTLTHSLTHSVVHLAAQCLDRAGAPRLREDAEREERGAGPMMDEKSKELNE